VTTIEGKTQPLLIEIKRSNEEKLVWTEKYISGLRNYARLLRIPLLVAWKRGHIWTLTEACHFEKRVTSHHLEFMKALAENLMSQVFGDCLVELTQRISFYLDGEIQTSDPLPQPPEPLPEGEHTITIKGAGFLLDDQPIDDLPSELTWLFLRAPDENIVKRTGEKTVRTIHTPTADTVFSLTDFALMLLLWSEPEQPDWDKVVRKKIPISAQRTRDALRKGLDLGVTRYVLEQLPVTPPSFTNAGRFSQIQKRAYEIYTQRQPDRGTAIDDWLRAEAELDAPGVI
jgi:hypothetical protein